MVVGPGQHGTAGPGGSIMFEGCPLLQVFADGAEALRMAEDVRLVDEAEWRATYPEAADALTPTATTAPAPTTSPGG